MLPEIVMLPYNKHVNSLARARWDSFFAALKAAHYVSIMSVQAAFFKVYIMSSAWKVVTATDLLKMVLISLLGWTVIASALVGLALLIGGDLSFNGNPWSELELDYRLALEIIASLMFTVLFSTLSFLFGRMVLIFLMNMMPMNKNAKT